MSRSYRILDHDPEIDKFKTLWRDERIKQADLAVLAGLNANTVKRMFSNETKRPQHATFAKMAHAMGYEYALTRENKPDYETELPKAKAEKREHLEALATARLVADVTKRKQAARVKNGKRK
jgi:transcriptional regulator with XRE-family HTH domain